MNLTNYNKAIYLKEHYNNLLEEITKKHEKDPDLSHTIEKDKDCLYCENYRTINKKLQKLLKEISLYEEKHQINFDRRQTDKNINESEQSKKNYKIYSFLFEDGSEYLIYTSSKKEGCQTVGKSLSSLVRQKLVSKKFFPSIYLEQENGRVHTLQEIVNTGLKNEPKVLGKTYVQEKKQISSFNKTISTCFIYCETENIL
ncbi:TPA: hypothetical protein ACN1M8_002161 [Enterococcus faecium]|nr:hypothetical protein DKP78_13640 [Enterococcus faecium]